MTDRIGRWVSQQQWQCQLCGAYSDLMYPRCQNCDTGVRPPATEAESADTTNQHYQCSKGETYHHPSYGPSDVEG